MSWRDLRRVALAGDATPISSAIAQPRVENSRFINLLWGGLVVTGIFGVGYTLSQIRPKVIANE